MKTISKYLWTWWVGIVPSLVGITFRDWRWWAFIVTTVALVELGYRVREQEIKKL
jgi:hypothetical protein